MIVLVKDGIINLLPEKPLSEMYYAYHLKDLSELLKL